MPISLSGSLVLTGSITTTGGITISGSILSASYADTASFANNFTVLGNLTVFGTQSVQYITSSQLNVSDNVITVNVASPGVRFGGLSVFDSGSLSSEATASLFWDSQNNHWIYQRESGSVYNGGMLISGPRNAAGLGNELGTTNCMLLVGQGGDHLTSSLIYHSSTVTCVPSCMIVGGAATINVPTDNTTVGVFHAGGGTANRGLKISTFACTNDNAGVRLDAQITVGGATLALATAGNDRLTISSTGAATFACTVMATQFLTNTTAGLNVGGWGTLSQTTSGQMTILGHNVIASGTTVNTVNVMNSGWISSMIRQYYSDGITFHSSPTVYSAGDVYPMAATERMRITNGGNVGIGACSPNSILEIQKDTNGDTPITFINGSGGSGNTNASITLDFILRNGSGGSSGGVKLKVGKETDHIGTNVNDYFAISTTKSDVMNEKIRLTAGGTLFYKGYFANNLMGGFSVIGTLSAINVGDRYLHARINTIGFMMYWIKVFGYSYIAGIIEGLGGGYIGGGTGGVNQGALNGSIVAMYQNNGFLEVVVDTINTATTNRWGSITFLGGTDAITTVQPLEIIAYSWTSTTTRVY